MKNFLIKFGSFNLRRRAGFNIIEILVAMAISSIVLTGSLGIIGTIYYNQKKINFSHDFYSESKFLMERIAKLMKDNTIDYDRYFFENKSIVCPSPDIKQFDSTTYTDLFYWDISIDSDYTDKKYYKNLGGLKPDGEVDFCTDAWKKNTKLDKLYLINHSRNLRTSIRYDENSIFLERQIAIDINNNGKVDDWKVGEWNGTTCVIEGGYTENQISGNPNNIMNFCLQSNEEIKINNSSMDIVNLYFQPSPNRDPFLNFKVKKAQIHPHVFISFVSNLKNPRNYNFTEKNKPTITLQTAVSSRIIGNIR